MEYLQKNEIVLAVLVIHLSQWGRSNKFRNHCLLVEYNLVSRSWLVVPTKPNPLLFNCLTWLDDDLTLPTLQINEYNSNHHPPASQRGPSIEKFGQIYIPYQIRKCMYNIPPLPPASCYLSKSSFKIQVKCRH